MSDVLGDILGGLCGFCCICCTSSTATWYNQKSIGSAGCGRCGRSAFDADDAFEAQVQRDLARTRADDAPPVAAQPRAEKEMMVPDAKDA